MNFVKDLFTREELHLHQIITKPFDIGVLAKVLKKRLKEEPDYEVYTPLIYYRCLQYLKDKTVETTIVFNNYFISNAGNVVVKKGEKYKKVKLVKSDEGYYRFWVSLGKKTGTFLPLHRAIACNFVPPKKGLKEMHLKRLQVNHIDGNKVNFSLGNLEWCTPKENIIHGFDNNIIVNPSAERHYRTKPVKGMVLSGLYKDYCFLLVGTKEIKNFGFSQSNVNACCLGLRSKHFNCSFEFASEEQIKILPRGLPDKVKNNLVYLNKLTSKLRGELHVR